MSEHTHEMSKELLPRAQAILSEKGYTKDCYPMRDLAITIENTEKNANRKISIYKWFGLPLLILIPVISALLSVLVTTDQPNFASFAIYLSLSLTLLTILNSIFRPGERFREACLIAIRISHFKSEFLTEIEKAEEITCDFLLQLVEKYRKAFERYQEQLIGLFLPERAGVGYWREFPST